MNVSPCCHKSYKFDINKCINALIIQTLMFSEAEVRALRDDDEGNYVVRLVKHLTTVRSASPHSDDDDSAMMSFVLLLLSLDPDVDAVTVVYKKCCSEVMQHFLERRASKWVQTTRSAVVQYCHQNTLVVFMFIFSLFAAENQGAAVGE